MKDYRRYLNFVFGGAASYLYLSAGSTLIAFTPISPSSFLFENCALEAVGNASASCQITNYLGIRIYDILHFAVTAVLIALVFGVMQKLLKRIGFPYYYSLLAAGFFLGWMVSALWFAEVSFPVPWFLVVPWSIEILTFIGVYFLIAKYVMALNSPDKLSELRL